MGSQMIHSMINPQPKTTYITSIVLQIPNNFSFRPNYKLLKPIIFSSYNNLNDKQQLVSIKQTQIPESDYVKFKTLGGCKLGISIYPDFEYNAEGGAGFGTATKIIEDYASSNADVLVDFDVEKLYIPPLSSATTKFLGVPLPPFLKIEIVPEAFRGNIDRESGKVDLKFSAKFCFSIGSIYKAPPLFVDTILTSEESKGKIRGGKGERLNKNGICRLVGVARVDPINDIFMDTFLNLPTECLANMNAIISFSDTA